MVEFIVKIVDVVFEVEKVEVVFLVVLEVVLVLFFKFEEFMIEKLVVDELVSMFYSFFVFNIIIFCEVLKIYVVLGEESWVF